MDATVWGPLAASVIGALLLYTYNRHRPKVDNSAEQRGWFNEVQEERDKAVERADKADERATAADARAESIADRNRELQARNDEILRENGALGEKFNALLGLYLATIEGVVSGSVPPFLQPPYVLHGVITPDLVPRWPERHFDTGVPGIDPNPPFPDPPAPPDDGQDHNLQE